MLNTGGRNFSSLTYIFGSFFGALMIAGVFAYNNYRFSQFKYINFEELIFYEKSSIFAPKSDRYVMLIYSSNMSNLSNLVSVIGSSEPILAVDLYQKRFPNTKKITNITGGTNTLLSLIKKMGISEVPCVFLVKKDKKLIYKQDSPIKIIEP